MENLPKNLPKNSGVYLFKNKKGEVLYVGRATSLKQRVGSYFQKNLDPRISEMVQKAETLDYKKTDNLLEAIILEANLIKKHWPKYNVKEKDNKSFVYLIIPKTEYPQPFITRERELEKFSTSARIFGPYQSYSSIKKALKIIRRIFPYSNGKCRPFSGRPCFDRQVGLCPGLCMGEISKQDYLKNIQNIVLLLSGKKARLLKKLEKENPEQAKALTHVQDVSLLSVEPNLSRAVNRIEGYDISHLKGKEPYGAMVVFEGREPSKDQYRLFKIKKAPKEDDLRALEETLLRRLKHAEWRMPSLILIDGGKPQIDYLKKSLDEKLFKAPLVGLSKFGGDRLVFPGDVKPSSRKLIRDMKPILLKVCDEAHRFSNQASRRERRRIGNRKVMGKRQESKR